MKKELDDALCAVYPELFKERHLDMTVTAMCWGFQCGDGWYQLIDSLCKVIQTEADRGMTEGMPSIYGVKEKLGALRIAVKGGNGFIYGAVRLAEEVSRNTCELCGKPSTIRQNNGWLFNRCNEHAHIGRSEE